GGERLAQKMAAEREQEEAWLRKQDEMRRQEEQAKLAAKLSSWGTKEARRMEVARVRREIAERAAKRSGGSDDAV
ncbi:MAG: hypothetical protein ABIQ03_00255, partial [Burkholderiales bacterium]